MLRIQLRPLSPWCIRVVLGLFLILLYGLFPSVALASSDGAAQSYTGYAPGGYPGCATYVYVHRGDTLSRIAARHGVSVHTLAQANHIANINRIYPGQQLCIPVQHKAYQQHDGKHHTDYPPANKHAKPGNCGCPADYHGDYHGDYHSDSHHGKDYGYAGDRYSMQQAYPPGYYESTGGHTGVRYYPDPRYNPAGAYYYEADQRPGHYRTYP